MKNNNINLKTDSEFEIHSTLYSFIGLEFEKICIKYLDYAFPSCTLEIHKRIYFDTGKEGGYIVPDVCITNISKTIAMLLHVHQNTKVIFDFKRSITAISLKDINYLNVVPDSTLILCLLHEESTRSWKKKIKIIIDPYATGDQRKKIISRILVWSAKHEYGYMLPEKKKKSFFEQLSALEQLNDIKKIEKINLDLISRITKRYDPLVLQCIKNLSETYDSLQKLKYLIILKQILKLTYFTKDELLSNITYSQPILEEALNVFLESNILQKKIFSDFLPHVYFLHQQQYPSLIDYFELRGQTESASGLKLLVKNNKIPISVIENSSFDEFRKYVKIDTHISVSSMFKICNLFEKELVISPEEAATSLQLHQTNTAELFRIMHSLGFLESYKLEWEATVKCYSMVTFKTLPLEVIEKYLPGLIRLSLEYIRNTTELEVNKIIELKQLFGSNWYSKLQIYGVFVKYKGDYPNGYDPDTTIALLRKEKLNHAFMKVRKLVAVFAKEELDLLAIERENSGTIGKIKRYIIKNQNNSLYQKQSELAFVKEKQIESGIKIIKNSTQLSKKDIKANLKDGWTTKVRIVHILKTKLKINERTITVERAMSLLEKNELNLSRTNFVRYLTPFSREPFNLLALVRTKKGENSPIESITIF